jgi:hypothetical protein
MSKNLPRFYAFIFLYVSYLKCYNTNNMGELKWFLYAFFGLWILWLVTGGATRYENRTRPLLKQPAPLEDGRAYKIN